MGLEDAMRLQLHCHGDIDLSQPGMQVEIRSHIARCLRDYPNGGEGVISLSLLQPETLATVARRRLSRPWARSRACAQ